MCNICELNKFNMSVKICRKIKELKTNIFKKTSIEIPYDVVIKDWDFDDPYGMFCQFCKVIYINKNIVNNDKLFEKVIYHEFLHLYLQVDTKLFYNVFRDRFTSTYFFYLNKYCDKYQVVTIYPYCDIWVKFKQTNTEGIRNQKLLQKNKSLSNNYGQFEMLSEFIIHNSDYYYQCDFNDEIFEDKILLEMNKFVFNLILENINKHTQAVKN